MKKARILIADDHDVVRSGLRMLLRTCPDFSVTAEAADGEEAIRLAEMHRPDVAILDIAMPKLDGIEATRIIKQRVPEVKVLILTVHEEEEYAHQILRAGASGYLVKNASRKEIFEAVRTVLAGKQFFSPSIAKLIVDGFVKLSGEHEHPARGNHDPSALPLTKREAQILEYIAQGFTNRQIADTLFLSFRTVNTHRANLMQKLQIHDTAGLVRYALSVGLIKADPGAVAGSRS